jgi:hypothetical protein
MTLSLTIEERVVEGDTAHSEQCNQTSTGRCAFPTSR